MVSTEKKKIPDTKQAKQKDSGADICMDCATFG